MRNEKKQVEYFWAKSSEVEGGECEIDEYRVNYAVGKESQRGVTIVLDKEMAKRVLNVEMVSNRIIAVKIQADPVDLFIIQVYAHLGT